MKCDICGIDLNHWNFLYEERDIKPPEEGIYCIDCIELYPEKVNKVDVFFHELIKEFLKKEKH